MEQLSERRTTHGRGRHALVPEAEENLSLPHSHSNHHCPNRTPTFDYLVKPVTLLKGQIDPAGRRACGGLNF